MALHDRCPHRITSLSSTTARDDGGGTTVTYTQVQANIPCQIDTVSGSEQELFSQMGLQVSHSISILTAALTTAIARGMKVTDEAGRSFHVEGIRVTRAFARIPGFTYLQCREIL